MASASHQPTNLKKFVAALVILLLSVVASSSEFDKCSLVYDNWYGSGVYCGSDFRDAVDCLCKWRRNNNVKRGVSESSLTSVKRSMPFFPRSAQTLLSDKCCSPDGCTVRELLTLTGHCRATSSLSVPQSVTD